MSLLLLSIVESFYFSFFVVIFVVGGLFVDSYIQFNLNSREISFNFGKVRQIYANLTIILGMTSPLKLLKLKIRSDYGEMTSNLFYIMHRRNTFQ